MDPEGVCSIDEKNMFYVFFIKVLKTRFYVFLFFSMFFLYFFNFVFLLSLKQKRTK